MVFVFKDIELRVNRCLIFEMKNIFGIGIEKAWNIASAIGLGRSLSLTFLNRYFFDSFSFLVKLYYTTDDRLLGGMKSRLNFLFSIKSRRGLRYKKRLPIRGQRTHSNGKQNRYHRNFEI